jgi:hypothetical protein
VMAEVSGGRLFGLKLFIPKKRAAFNVVEGNITGADEIVSHPDIVLY